MGTLLVLLWRRLIRPRRVLETLMLVRWGILVLLLVVLLALLLLGWLPGVVGRGTGGRMRFRDVIGCSWRRLIVTYQWNVVPFIVIGQGPIQAPLCPLLPLHPLSLHTGGR